MQVNHPAIFERALYDPTSTISLITGFHTNKSASFRENKNNDENDFAYVINGLNLVGWTPVIGAVAGIARLLFATLMYLDSYNKETTTPEERAFYAAMVLRGVFEICFLGFLFIPIDIIFTVGRQIAHTSK